MKNNVKQFIDYGVDGKLCKTKCKFHASACVGSVTCQFLCKHFVAIDKEKQVVTCRWDGILRADKEGTNENVSINNLQ
jgi:hypothetical protein